MKFTAEEIRSRARQYECTYTLGETAEERAEMVAILDAYADTLAQPAAVPGGWKIERDGDGFNVLMPHPNGGRIGVHVRKSQFLDGEGMLHRLAEAMLAASPQPAAPVQDAVNQVRPYNPTEQMVRAMKVIDPAMPVTLCRDLYRAAWGAFSQPSQAEPQQAERTMPPEAWMALGRAQAVLEHSQETRERVRQALDAPLLTDEGIGLLAAEKCVSMDAAVYMFDYEGAIDFARTVIERAALAQQGKDAERDNLLELVKWAADFTADDHQRFMKAEWFEEDRYRKASELHLALASAIESKGGAK